MAEVDHVAEFTPAELDLLEDALEDPELAIEGSALLRGRLNSYREILALTADALPPIEVPDGLLDGVLKEALSSATVDLSPTAASVEAPKVGLWQRLRRSMLLPGVALAATAVLLVVVLKPDGSTLTDVSEGTVDRSPSAVVEARAAGSEVLPPPAPELEEDAEVAAMAVPAVAPSRERMEAPSVASTELDQADSLAADQTSPRPVEQLKRRRAKSKKSATQASGSSGIADDSDPNEPAKGDAGLGGMVVDAEDKEALRSLLQAADEDRHRGRCAAASKAYSRLLGVKGNEEARALMGLGLCAEAQGDVVGAEAYYRRAKSLNPALDPLISAERGKMASSQGDKRAKKKQSKKTKSQLD
ncbi:MAG TPA: hypothetical protein ENK31_03875 [Nannocystis exedens]|nr:hypothetical protein [Nannocystis exedens]